MKYYLILLLAMVSCNFNQQTKVKKPLALHDSCIIYCSKCVLIDTILEYKITGEKNLWSLELISSPQRYLYETVKSHFLNQPKKRIVMCENQKIYFNNLFKNSTYTGQNFKNFDIFLMTELKYKNKSDTFVFFNRRFFGLNGKIYNSKTENIHHQLIRLFPNIDNYCN